MGETENSQLRRDGRKDAKVVDLECPIGELRTQLNYADLKNQADGKLHVEEECKAVTARASEIYKLLQKVLQDIADAQYDQHNKRCKQGPTMGVGSDADAAMRTVQMYKTQEELKVARAKLVEVETENSQLRLKVAPCGDGREDAKVVDLQGQSEGQAAVDLLNLQQEVQQLKTRLRQYEDVDRERVGEGVSSEVLPPQPAPTEKLAVDQGGKTRSVSEKKAAPPPPPRASSGKPKSPPAKAKGAEPSPGPKQSSTPASNPKPKGAKNAEMGTPEKAARSTGEKKRATPKR